MLRVMQDLFYLPYCTKRGLALTVSGQQGLRFRVHGESSLKAPRLELISMKDTSQDVYMYNAGRNCKAEATRTFNYLEGHGDLVSRLVRGITGVTIWVIGGINLLTKSP